MIYSRPREGRKKRVRIPTPTTATCSSVRLASVVTDAAAPSPMAADTASTASARQVWVLPGDGKDASAKPVSVAVVPGISDGHMTEITSGDLKAGMQVVTAQKTAGAQ